MPCNPNDISVPIPTESSESPIPGFSTPFALPTNNTNPFPSSGFPEDLLDLLNKLQLLVPPGALKPQLNPNFGKDVYDGILKLLDQFMPFLMLYKFFLPILNIIICIIEVLCAIPNPFKLVQAMIRLFTVCIPEFLNMFPIFAIVIMIISLLLLLIALVEYIVSQVLKLVTSLIRNINMLSQAFEEGSASSVLAIAQKIGTLLCIFQNLFVLLSIFATIIQVIKDILKLAFPIPPCDDSNTSSAGCCTPDVCPEIVKNTYTNFTGTFQYLNGVSAVNAIAALPAPFNNFVVGLRNESWQLYDSKQNIAQAFRNIIDGYDVPVDISNPPPFFKPIFFPTDGYIKATTSPKQAPYTVDLRLFYNPKPWGRNGNPRFIIFKDCIVLDAPKLTLSDYKNDNVEITTGVLTLGGGLGYEDDGVTTLSGFDSDGITTSTNQATLSNFVHIQDSTSSLPSLNVTDGYTFSNIQYTFKPNIAPLISYNLVTLGCAPDLALNKNFINAIYAGDIALKTNLLNDLINGANFPDPNACQQCLTTALSGLRSDLTLEGVANFQATVNVCLGKLQSDSQDALGNMVGLGFDPCSSSLTIDPNVQFTSKPILVSVDLKERNGISITTGISGVVAENIGARLKAYPTFGVIDNFVFDGYHTFTANLTSTLPGLGSVMVSFDDNMLCTNINSPPSHTLQEAQYQFVYTPIGSGASTGEIDTDGQPRRDYSDLGGS